MRGWPNFWWCLPREVKAGARVVEGVVLLLIVLVVWPFSCITASPPARKLDMPTTVWSSPTGSQVAQVKPVALAAKPEGLSAAAAPAKSPETGSTTRATFPKPVAPIQATPRPSRTLVGSSLSDKYHRPSCEWARRISAGNEVWFSDPDDARRRGYVPCKVCRPW